MPMNHTPRHRKTRRWLKAATVACCLTIAVGLSILAMADLDADGDFYDEVHPKPRVTMSWARRLADALGPVMGRPADQVAAPAGKQQAERGEP